MARLPRLVLPGIPHHVTQRGNGRGQTFFEQGDYRSISICWRRRPSALMPRSGPIA
jgi:REP element-mobilizing transposase RayT